MLVIGICGASGSGKSTLAKALSLKLRGTTLLLNQDAYYRDHAYLPFEERVKINYDEPDVFEHDELLYDIHCLKQGKSITRKAYDYAHHCRADLPDEMIAPPDTVIIEGIHAFHDPRLRELMDFKLYMSVDPDICLLRRIKRDIVERGRDILGIETQYLATVKPMYEKYIRAYVNYADIIVAGGGKNAKINDMLATYINTGFGASEGTASV
ncbi:MAG: uridine kinase [Clostridia bacterium]|nr:uridine kinase [Clostridia bacterium]